MPRPRIEPESLRYKVQLSTQRYKKADFYRKAVRAESLA